MVAHSPYSVLPEAGYAVPARYGRLEAGRVEPHDTARARFSGLRGMLPSSLFDFLPMIDFNA